MNVILNCGNTKLFLMGAEAGKFSCSSLNTESRQWQHYIGTESLHYWLHNVISCLPRKQLKQVHVKLKGHGQEVNILRSAKGYHVTALDTATGKVSLSAAPYNLRQVKALAGVLA